MANSQNDHDKKGLFNLHCNSQPFNLKDLMLVAPGNQPTERWLAWLEAEGYLPPTIAWLNQNNLKVRLYRCPNDFGTFEIMHGHINLIIENHPRDIEYLPGLEERLKDFHMSGGDMDMFSIKAAELPDKTREFFRLLQVMDIWDPYSLPECFQSNAE